VEQFYDDDDEHDEDDRDSSSSEHEDEDDEDYSERKPGTKTKIDKDSYPAKKNTTKKGSKTIREFSTVGGVHGTSTQDGDHFDTHVKGMRKLPPGFRAPTDPAPNHITLHSDAKGPKGRRKYNEKDQVSSHLGGMATFGVPAQKGLGMSLDASPHYNRQHLDGHEKKLLAIERGDGSKKKRTWEAMSEVDVQDPMDPDRLKMLVDNTHVTEDRAKSRILAAKKKSPDIKSIAKYKTTLTSDKGEEIEDEYGPDYMHLAKPSWMRKSYDPDDSSGDDDIDKGVV
jgi:hypothetical protein